MFGNFTNHLVDKILLTALLLHDPIKRVSNTRLIGCIYTLNTTTRRLKQKEEKINLMLAYRQPLVNLWRLNAAFMVFFQTLTKPYTFTNLIAGEEHLT